MGRPSTAYTWHKLMWQVSLYFFEQLFVCFCPGNVRFVTIGLSLVLPACRAQLIFSGNTLILVMVWAIVSRDLLPGNSKGKGLSELDLCSFIKMNSSRHQKRHYAFWDVVKTTSRQKLCGNNNINVEKFQMLKVLSIFFLTQVQKYFYLQVYM